MRRKVIDPRISVAIVVLAAGRSSRMVEGRRHKLLALFDGQSLVRRSVSTALASDCGSVVVVTGHRSTEIAAQVRDLPCEVIHNAEYASGIAGSLRTGVKAASKGCPGGIMIMLADMPRLSTGHVDTLIAAFRSGQGRVIARAVGSGSPGNPVIFPHDLYNDLQILTGDVGARSLIEMGNVPVLDVEIGEAALADVDTAEEMLAEGGIFDRQFLA
jgi:molybdenum cofactor cytidylyltransferase